MQNYRSKIFLIAFGIIVFLALLFKPVYAPKIDNSGNFGLDSKSTKGFYGIKTLLEKSVNRKLIKNDSFTLKNLKYKKGVTALFINTSIHLNNDQSRYLSEFINAGNTAIFLTNNLEYNTKILKGKKDVKKAENLDSLLIESVDSLELDENLPEQEAEFEENHVDGNPIPSDTSNNNNIPSFDFSENCKQVYFVKSGLRLDTSLSKKIHPSTFVGFEGDTVKPFLQCGERLIAYNLNFQNGDILIHHAPELFSNMYLKEKWYKENAEIIFDHLRGEEIYIINTELIDELNSFLLSELLKKKPLKYAYYWAMALVLISILASLKRRYRPTKVMVEKQNLSMQYAKSLSRLFFVESDYYNMVLKIRENFFHYVQKHFYLSPTDPDYVKLLAKRTGVSTNMIQSILTLCEVTKNQNWTNIILWNYIKKPNNSRKYHQHGNRKSRKSN